MFRSIDRLLNGITMYKVVLYLLIALAGSALTLSFLGLISANPLSLALSLVVLVFVGYGVNELIARILKIPANPESSVITALSLFFVLHPASNWSEVLFLVAAVVIAMASKYILAFRGQHIFNPAAVGAIAVGIPTGIATWWIGTPYLLPFVIVAALLMVRKVRRFELFFAVLIPGILVATLYGMSYGQTAPAAMWQYLASWPVVFFAAFMVTEPFTSPGTRKARWIFGSFVGIISSIPLSVGIVYSTPELSLALGNLGSFFTGLRRRLTLRFVRRVELAHDTYGFHFAVADRPAFVAGQYLEWTLPHTPDARGIRRFFTIASSPSEEELAIGVKFFPEGSSFKKRLLELQPGDTAYASMRGGDFILPLDTSEKLAFIAGGIGVTPFRSMVRSILDTGEKRDITLFYACKKGDEVAYRELWAEAEQVIGMKTVCVLSEDPEHADVEHGFITQELLARRLPDWKERTFYLSGPDAMVQAYKKLLRTSGVSSKRIRTDYFPGF